MSFPSTHLTRFSGWDDPDRRDQLLLFLFDRFDCLVAHHCARSRVQPADAEDIAQKLWVRLRPKFGEFLARYRQPDRRTSFRAWLATCTRNLICDLFRDRSKTNGELPAELPHEELSEDVATDLDTFPLSDECLDCAVRLTRERVLPINWEAFVGRVLLGRSYSDLATEQNRTANAVKAGVRRVRQILDELYRACLNENPAP